VTERATDLRPFTNMDCATTIIIALVIPISRSTRENSAIQVIAMAGLTGIGIAAIEVFMSKIPTAAVNIVHTMGAIQGIGQTGVAGGALSDRAGVPLDLSGGHIVIGAVLSIRPDRMGRAVAALAGNTTMPQAVAVQLCAISGKP